MKSGIAGRTIVSPYIVTRANPLMMQSETQAERGMPEPWPVMLEEGGSFFFNLFRMFDPVVTIIKMRACFSVEFQVICLVLTKQFIFP